MSTIPTRVLCLKTKYENLLIAEDPQGKHWLAALAVMEPFGYHSNIRDPKQKELYDQACTGDVEAARKFMELRQDYEYEEWCWERLYTAEERAPCSGSVIKWSQK